MMGASVQISGEIRIDPPVAWNHIKGSEFLKGGKGYGYPHDLQLRVIEDPEDTDEGTLIRRHVDAIVSSGFGEPRGDRLEEEVDAMLDDIGPGHTYSGRLDISCRDYETQWRIKVVERDGLMFAVRFDPQIVWPQESE